MRKKHWVLIVLSVYVVLVTIGVGFGLALPNLPYGYVTLLVLGLPWDMLAIPFMWTLTHNTTYEGLILMFVIFTLPNVVLLLRWFGILHVKESVEV